VSCSRRGRHWQVALGQRSVLVDHRIGMLHLAALVANPGQEIDAIDLAAVAAVKPAGDLPDRIAQLEGHRPARRARWRWLLAGATLANLAALTAAAMCCAALGRVMTGVMT
jgi:hypothetical protein